MSEWISVDKQTPEEGQNVLACCFVKRGVMQNLLATGWGRDKVYHTIFKDNHYLIHGYYSHYPFTPTHWMPLPAEPNDE